MPSPSTESLGIALRLTQALQLARRGRMADAQALVMPAGVPPTDPVELHAAATLATVQGDYRRALPLWRLLCQRRPGDREARRMIDAIELWQARPPWMKWVVPVGASLLGLALLVGLLALV